jgi:hypothetical protein
MIILPIYINVPAKSRYPLEKVDPFFFNYMKLAVALDSGLRRNDVC